jgi:hypothetical protein
MRTVPCVLAVACFSLALPHPAAARPPEAPGISYRAPPACPTQAAFLEHLRSRLGASQAAGGSGRGLDVQIIVSGDRYVGRLSLIASDGRSTNKTLSDADCGELVDALALVAALALETDGVEHVVLDPGQTPAVPAPAPAPLPAPLAPPPPPASSPAPAPTAPPLTRPPASAPTQVPAPESTPALAPVRAPDSTPTPAVEASSTSMSGPRLGVALAGFAATGPAPTPLFGPALTLRLVWRAAGLLRPTLELGGAASFSLDAAEAKGTATFEWWTARAIAYLLQASPGGGVALRGGVAGDFGVLLARGSHTASPATSSRPWASLGLAAGLEVPLGSRVALLPAVAVEAPLRRDRYAFGSTDFFEVPRVIATGSVAIVAYLR